MLGAQKRSGRTLGTTQYRLRGAAAYLVGLILPYRANEGEDSFERAAALLSEGYGLVVLMNHFSTRDAPQVLSFLCRNRAICRYPFLAPVAFHQYRQYGLLVRALADWFAIRLQPIVTARTVKKLGAVHKRGHGLTDYLQQASRHLDNGGVMLLAPQGGRRSRLGKPRGRPLGRLLAQAEVDDVQHVAFCFLGLGLDGQGDYDGNVAGFNLGRRYEITVGPTVTLREMLEETDGVDQVDDWVFAQLARLVPDGYRR